MINNDLHKFSKQEYTSSYQVLFGAKKFSSGEVSNIRTPSTEFDKILKNFAPTEA